MRNLHNIKPVPIFSNDIKRAIMGWYFDTANSVVINDNRVMYKNGKFYYKLGAWIAFKPDIISCGWLLEAKRLKYTLDMFNMNMVIIGDN